jgi:hypothetical protein
VFPGELARREVRRGLVWAGSLRVRTKGEFPLLWKEGWSVLETGEGCWLRWLDVSAEVGVWAIFRWEDGMS